MTRISDRILSKDAIGFHGAAGMKAHSYKLRLQGREKTKMFAAFPGFSSFVMPSAEEATSEVPVVTAMYCLPPTAYAIGTPLTGDPRIVSYCTAPVLSSRP